LSPLRDRWKIIVAMDRLLAHMLATAKHERYRGERYGDQRSEGGAKTLWCFSCHHDLRLSALMANACTGSRFLHRQHIEKLSKDQGMGGGKIFYRGISHRGNGYRYRGAKSGSTSCTI
jgi:hypothetical protein